MGVVQGDAAFPPRCIAPNDGTIGLPGPCPWLPIPGQPILLPVTPDSSIEMHFNVDSFFDIEYQIGGTFGPDGEIMTCQADLTINVRGTGALTDFERTLFVPVNIELHWPSADPAASQQDFPNEMVRLEGELFGDPDFDSLHIEGGSSFDLPSPGHTKRTQLPGGNFHVDSFFDIVYRIEWQGAPGSILDGLGGLARGTERSRGRLDDRTQHHTTEVDERPDRIVGLAARHRPRERVLGIETEKRDAREATGVRHHHARGDVIGHRTDGRCAEVAQSTAMRFFDDELVVDRVALREPVRGSGRTFRDPRQERDGLFE